MPCDACLRGNRRSKPHVARDTSARPLPEMRFASLSVSFASVSLGKRWFFGCAAWKSRVCAVPRGIVYGETAAHNALGTRPRRATGVEKKGFFVAVIVPRVRFTFRLKRSACKLARGRTCAGSLKTSWFPGPPGENTESTTDNTENEADFTADKPRQLRENAV